MKLVAAGLGLLWAAGNVVAALLFLANGLAAKTAAKGLIEQALLILGGLLLLILAALLAWQCIELARSGAEETGGDPSLP